MRLLFNDAIFSRGGFSIAARGSYSEGIHLVSGRIGTGKTTIAMGAAGLLPPTQGFIEKDGIGTGMISFQFPEYHVTGLTVGEEIASWGLNPDSLPPDPLLTHERPLTTLSRGELKRFHLSCVLARRSDLLILDEPFASLDCREKIRLSREIAGISGVIILICTHETRFLPPVTTISEIRNNTLVLLGSPPDAITDWEGAPRIIRQLREAGNPPDNIDPGAVEEALCRTRA